MGEIRPFIRTNYGKSNLRSSLSLVPDRTVHLLRSNDITINQIYQLFLIHVLPIQDCTSIRYRKSPMTFKHEHFAYGPGPCPSFIFPKIVLQIYHRRLWNPFAHGPAPFALRYLYGKQWYLSAVFSGSRSKISDMTSGSPRRCRIGRNL